jgi:hypothetical protein
MLKFLFDSDTGIVSAVVQASMKDTSYKIEVITRFAVYTVVIMLKAKA